jgi:hypothetical protein
LRFRLAGSLDERIRDEAGFSAIDDRPRPRSSDGVPERRDSSEAVLLTFFLPKNPVKRDETELCRFFAVIGSANEFRPPLSCHDLLFFLAQKNSNPHINATTAIPDITPAMIPELDDF